MKANVRYGAVALLWIAACNRPDEVLFDDVPIGDGVTAGNGASSAAAGTSAAGSSNDAGGTGATTSVGGTMPTAGGPVDMDSAGSPGTPDGSAGAPDNVGGSSNTAGTGGTGGTGEPPKPPEPVCGNGKLEAGEECDDSGHTGKDGCDACKVVCADFGSGTLESEDHHCYNGYDAATFDGAIEACKERGAHLATISSEAENKLAQKLVNNSKWLGGHEDVASNVQGTGDYAWVTGEAFTYENWGRDEPNLGKVRCDGGGIGPGPGPASSCYQHCVSMLGDGSWASARCELSDGYVCEWEPAGAK
jgi:hypothetical protein